MLLLCLEDGWVWPLDSFVSCRISVTSTVPFAVSDHTIGLVPVQCREHDGKPPAIIFSKLRSAAH